MGRRVALRFRTVALIGLCLTVVLEFTLGVAAASATTLIMPNREALMGTAVVVWGNTTQANGTADSIDCGNGTVIPGPTVVDQSYISATCTYAATGTFNAKLTVGAEVATAVITVSDPLGPAFNVRNTKINMAIEDGLRSLYYNQFNRAARFGTNMTSWRSANGGDNFTNSFSALAVLAIQNHGHAVNGPATDIFQPVVQNGLNWFFDNMVQRDLTPCNESGMNPCVGVPAPLNTGLSAPLDGLDGYTTPILAAAIGAATAAAPARTVGAGIGSANSNFVAGKPYSEILQRLTNAVSWGQTGDDTTGGGFYYNLNPGFLASDGSTMGWSMLGLENAGAAGAQIPASVKSRLATMLTKQLNTDGSLDYQFDSNPASDNAANVAKTGIGLQGLAFSGAAAGDPRVTAAIGYLTRNWGAVTVDLQSFLCLSGSPTHTNKGCGYAMFNNFKGLRLYGINTLPGIGRPPGPGPIPADDWYADYVDNLLTNQQNPTNPTGGDWSAPTMGFSSQIDDTTAITALAELILAPTAFVQPSAVALAPVAASNPVGTNHTVTATATTAAGAPAPGVTVTFTVLSGPNAGPATCTETGGNTNTTDNNGQAKCTYHDNGGAGTDQIQASIGAIVSNVVTKIWGGAAVATNIPTLSEWGLVVMAALLGLASLWALRRRKDRTS